VWLSMLVSQMFQASVLLGVYQLKNWTRFSMIRIRTEREQ